MYPCASRSACLPLLWSPTLLVVLSAYPWAAAAAEPTDSWFAALSVARAELELALDQGAAPPADPLAAQARVARLEALQHAQAAEQAAAELARAEEVLLALPEAAHRQSAQTDAAAAEVTARCPSERAAVDAAVATARTGRGDQNQGITALVLRCGDSLEVQGSVARLDAALAEEAALLARLADGERLAARVSDLRAEADAAQASADAARRTLSQLQTPSSDGDGRATHARSAAAAFARAQLALPDHPGHLPATAWCEAWGLGGVAMAMAGDMDAAEDALAVAASAWGGQCRPLVAQHLDQPEVQAAWAAALYRQAVQGVSAVQVETGLEDWTLDGQPLRGVTTRTLRLSPGLHRFVRVTEGGGLQVLLEEVLPDAHLRIWGDATGLHAESYEADALDWIAPTARTGGSAAATVVVREAAPAPERRAALGLDGAWLVLEGRDHLGVTASGGRDVLRRPRLSLAVGLAHDQLSSEHSYRYTTSWSSHFLLRERALLDLAVPLGPLSLGAELSLGGVPPSHALVWQADGLLRLRLGDQLSGHLSIGAQGARWTDHTSPPAPTASVGLRVHL